MEPLLYGRLAPWYRLIDPPSQHAEEAAAYATAFARAVPEAQTLLELGAGGGHNALYLKNQYHCTLTDIAPDMLALSRDLNPECEHILGDMRTLRLEREFDVVLVHDAIMYMLTEAELADAVRTAAAHVRPGGAVIFAPDCRRETFAESSDVLEASDGQRALRGLSWTWDPDAADTTYVVDYAYMLRDGAALEVVHDRHTEGVFDTATWLSVLGAAGLRVDTFARPLDEAGASDEAFIARRAT